MCNRETLTDSHNTTSSQESADGPSPLTLPDGLEIDLLGLPLYPASPGVALESNKAPQMTAISGRISSGSGDSVNLQLALESSLQTRLARVGLTRLPMTLKAKDTPLHRRYCEHVLSMPRTNEQDCFGLLPTVTAREGRDWSRGQILASLDNGTGVAKRICNRSTTTQLSDVICGLNPSFAAWMMGYPPEWLRSMRLAMQSCRKSRRNSEARIWTL